MDLTGTITPNSEQINAEDLLAGPRTVTITGVEAGTKDQPVFIHTAEYPDRTYRPGKSMRRVLVVCWGQDSAAYIGRKITIYNDPTVKWGGQPVGGIRISAASDIAGPTTIALTITRGKRAPFIVEPLDIPKDTSGRDWLAELALTNEDLDLIKALGTAATEAHAAPVVVKVIREEYKRVAALASEVEL